MTRTEGVELATVSPRKLAFSLKVPPSERSTLLILLCIATASVLIRIPFLAVPLTNDEGGYAYVAHFMSPHYQLYRDIPFYRPQAIFYLYRLILVFGTRVEAFRLFAALYNAATVGAMFILARMVSSRRTAVAVAVMFSLFSAAPSMEGFTANAEIFAQLPIVLAAILTWRQRWAWAGIMAASAVLLKPSGVSALVLAVSWAFVTGASLRGAARTCIAFTLGLLPSVLHGAWIGWQYYLDSMFRYRANYATGGSFGFRTQLVRLTLGVVHTAPSWGIPASLAAVGASGKSDRARLFGLLWLGASAAGMAMGGFWYWHYFIQAVPPLALLAGIGLPALARGRSRWFWSVPIAVSIVLFSREVALWTSSRNAISWQVFGKPAYLLSDDIVAIIDSNTMASDSIFVAFGEAQIYYLARRKASFPHMYYADFYYSEELFDGAVNSIRRGQPAVVVVAQPPPPQRMSWETFMELLSSRYEPIRILHAGPPDAQPIMIFRRKGTS